MKSKIAFTLLARSPRLARSFALHVLRKADNALPAVKSEQAVRVSVFGLIEVCVEPDSDALGRVRSELEANRVVFGPDEFPDHLAGRVDGIPLLRIWVGHKSTLHLATGLDEGIHIRRP